MFWWAFLRFACTEKLKRLPRDTNFTIRKRICQ